MSAAHPPWLRFQAYVVGLPKTGSTSVAALFGDFRSAHEWDMRRLLELGIARNTGLLDEPDFWQAAGPRLSQPRLEMDSCTSHHLYADLLSQRFPAALFVHTVRDVRGWANSLLDMAFRMKRVRRILGIGSEDWNEGMQYFTGDHYSADMDDDRSDADAVIPLMRRWAEHMERMQEVLPPDRTLVVRTRDLSDLAPDLADFVGVSREALRIEHGHSRRAPLTFDRFELLDRTTLLSEYATLCGPMMALHFPEEDERLRTSPRSSATAERWREYVEGTDTWAQTALAEHGERIAF